MLPSAPACLTIATLFTILSALPAQGQDAGRRSGFYLGAHVGYMFGNANATLGDPIGIATAGGNSPYGSIFGGVQAGYEHFFNSRLMLGIELDASFPDYLDPNQVLAYRATATGTATEQWEYMATLRGRAGYAMGPFTPFVTGGIAWASTRFSRIDLTTGNEDANPSNVRLGYAVGTGVDYQIDSRWSARAEYLYTNLGLTGFLFASAPARYDTQYDLHRFRIGLNYKFGEVDDKKTEPDDRGPGSFEVRGQTAFVYQGYPPMSATFDGAQSLPQAGQSRETWANSLSVGVRLWPGGEFYYGPELLQGFGLALTTGAGGFPNGEAQRAFPYPRYSTSRLFLRQTWGFGGEKEHVEGDLYQVTSDYDVSRLSVQVGRYAVQDLFDNNSYANDSRTDFLNWSIWAAGAFDYAADSVGYSWGITFELNQPSWSLRLGYFLEPANSDTNVFDMNLGTRGSFVAEGEARYTLWDRPGVTRVGAWLNSAYAGSYNQAVALALANPGSSPTNTILLTRQGRFNYGFYLSAEQQITDNIGAFLRLSWNDGRNEVMSFTDIDASISGGLSIKGDMWGRPGDTIGIGGAVNQISPDLQNYLANGGLGILVGDGTLAYASEIIGEAYYSLQVVKGLWVTADYQYLANPGYNAVRGPVHVLSGRLMAKF